MSVQAIERDQLPAEKIFDIGIDQTLTYDQLFVLGLQNIFGMTGMFVFPGILGRSYGLAPPTDRLSLRHDVRRLRLRHHFAIDAAAAAADHSGSVCREFREPARRRT